jgi:hypothetical protein
VLQAQGEWSEEEHQLFLATAAAHGVGDKWGLFASHLLQRVGYQCSAYYRQACPVAEKAQWQLHTYLRPAGAVGTAVGWCAAWLLAGLPAGHVGQG